MALPDKIKIEGPRFDGLDEVAIALGNLYGQEGVDRQQEVQAAIVRIGKNNYRYLTPGWGPVDSTNVNTGKLYDAYEKLGYPIVSWFHGHFDYNFNFSSIDFEIVFHPKDKNANRVTYMVNRNLEVRKLTNKYLYKKMQRLPFRKRSLSGLQFHYSDKGLPGVKL